MKKIIFLFIVLSFVFVPPVLAEEANPNLVGPISPSDNAFEVYIVRDNQRGVDCYFRPGGYATTPVCIRRSTTRRSGEPRITGPVQRGSGLEAIYVYTLIDPMWLNVCYFTHSRRGVHTPSCIHISDAR